MWGAYVGVPGHIHVYKVFSQRRRDPDAYPHKLEDSLRDSIECPFDIPGRTIDVRARLPGLFQAVPKLHESRLSTSATAESILLFA